MRYGIITNPAAGRMSRDEMLTALTDAAQVLNAGIQGLDTHSKEELAECAQQLALRNDVIVVAGGDGTFSDIINALETSEKIFAYLPLGTGNALGHALGYRGSLREAALQIKKGSIRSYDLIDCDHRRRAFIVSVGIEGHILGIRNRYRRSGIGGFAAYAIALLRAYVKDYAPAAAHIQVNGSTIAVQRLLTLMVMKQPFYGFGLKVAPLARFDDGKLHAVAIPSGSMRAIWGLATSLTVGNRTGYHETGQRVTLSLDRPLTLQTDGNRAWDADRFVFTILPGSLRIKR